MQVFQDELVIVDNAYPIPVCDNTNCDKHKEGKAFENWDTLLSRDFESIAIYLL